MKTSPLKTHKIILLCLAGGTLEWYDFAIFSFLAALIAQIFFPSSNKFLGLFATFFIFASGFIVRPIGAILLGNYGDRYGRKKSLSLSILLMTSATLGIGLIPSYATIGLFAPLLLLALRLLQGFSVGAEYSGAITYLAETSLPNRRSFNTSFSLLGTILGSILGGLLCGFITLWLSEKNMLAYGWRIPFLLGFPLGYLGYYLRKKAWETPEFIKIAKASAILKYPFFTLLKQNRKALLLTFLLFAPGNLLIYLFIVYFPTKLYHLHVMSLTKMLYTNTFNLTLEALLVIVIGWIGDKVGLIKPIKWGLTLLLLFAVPVFYLAFANQWVYFFLAQMLVVSIYAVAVSCIPAYVASVFATPVRFSGVSTGLNLSASLFGGTAPMVALLLEKLSFGFLWLSLYLIIIGFFGLAYLVYFSRHDAVQNNFQ